MNRRLSLALAAAALAATFARPTVPMERPRYEHVVVLDVTQSMNVADVSVDGRAVSRLDAARQRLRAALDELPCGSRLGLGLFTEYRSYLLLAPLEVCGHRAELRDALARIDGRMAWTGNSEIAKGLHSGITIVRDLAGKPGLVFVTDGHEAPPLNPRFRPHFDDKPGEVAGLVVGVGDARPSPIPKRDPLGRPLGTWGADEVLQTDPRSLGRGASVGGERMADDGAGGAAAGLGATPGAEHLSGLREPYLKLLAAENGFAYLRLGETEALADALRAPAFARPVPVRADARIPLALLAFGLVAWPWLAPWGRTLSAAARRWGWRRRA